MSGPWYQETGPSTKDVKQMLFTAQWDAQFGETNSAWYPIMKRRVIDIVISKEEEQRHVSQSRGPCWGSYRGYYSFLHSELLSKCLEEGQKFRKEKARKKLLKFMNDSIWIQDRLYRPCDGLRYKNVERNFDNVRDQNLNNLH